MRLLNCSWFLSAVAFVSIFLAGCVEVDAEASNMSKLNYANLKWSATVAPRTGASYAYIFEKSEEDVLRACLVSATHYPAPPEGAWVDRFCFSPRDVLFYRTFTIELDGKVEWEVCKVRNKWHCHFDIDRDSEMKLYSLLQKILEKQPSHILEQYPPSFVETLPPHMRDSL